MFTFYKLIRYGTSFYFCHDINTVISCFILQNYGGAHKLYRFPSPVKLRFSTYEVFPDDDLLMCCQ